MKTLRIPHSLIIGQAWGLDVKNLALFHDPLFDFYYIDLNHPLATWLLLQHDLDVCWIDATILKN